MDIAGLIKQQAIELGASEEEAENFKTILHLEAYRLGASAKGTAQFETSIQLRALEAGANEEDALQFTTDLQLEAFKAGASLTKVLQFKTDLQLDALKEGANEEEALHFETDVQLAAFKTSVVTVMQALACENWKQVECLQLLAAQYAEKSEETLLPIEAIIDDGQVYDCLGDSPFNQKVFEL